MKEEHNFEHAVFKSAALVENQADADKAKRICIDNELPTWKSRDAFDINDSGDDDKVNYLLLGDVEGRRQFYIDMFDEEDLEDLDIILLTDFQALAEDYSCGEFESIEDILAIFKQVTKSP